MKYLALVSISLLPAISPVMAQTKAQPRQPAGTVAVVPPTPAKPADPPGMTRLQKLAQIDYEIAWYEAQESKGAWLIAGGLASSLLAIPLWIPNDEGEVNVGPASLLNVAGVALIWWGVSSRWDAKEYLRLLRVKRYDFTLGPLYLPDQGGAAGMIAVARF